jgi:hypothetical protein
MTSAKTKMIFEELIGTLDKDFRNLDDESDAIEELKKLKCTNIEAYLCEFQTACQRIDCSETLKKAWLIDGFQYNVRNELLLHHTDSLTQLFAQARIRFKLNKEKQNRFLINQSDRQATKTTPWPMTNSNV